MNTQKIVASVFLLFCGSLFLLASAGRTISGKVYDINNEGLIGVTICVLENVNIGTITDVEGHYVLTLPDDKSYTLKISSMGYSPQVKELKGKGSDILDFCLEEDVVNLNTVVVTGTRTPKLLKDTPIPTRVITLSEIQKADATHIGELLQSELPGVEFTYEMNQQTSLNLQGFAGNSVLFLVDGERIAGETLNNIDYSRLDLTNVERIEIVKGAASSLYGSSAVGGVVNIISRTVSEPWSANVNARVADHNKQRYGTSIGFNVGKFNSMTTVQRTNSGEHRMKNDGLFSKVYANNTLNLNERLQYKLNNQIKFIGRAGYSFREREAKVTDYDRYRGYTLGLKGEYIINKKSNAELGYTFDQYDKSNYLLAAKEDNRNYRNAQHSVRGLYNYTFLDKHTITIGGDFMHDYLMSYQFADNGSYDQYIIDGFAQLDWNPLDWFNLIAGVRYDYFSKAKMDHLSSKIGLMFKFNHCSLRASYAGGFRAPTLKELYMEFDMANIFMIYGNPNLKPELSHNFSLTAEYTKGHYNLLITGYYNKVKNRIATFEFDDSDNKKYMNTKKVHITGIETNAMAKYPCGITARISYNYTCEKIKKEELRASNTRPHSATARVDYGKNWESYGFNVALSGRYLSKLNTVKSRVSAQIPLEEITYPAYFMGKLSLTQRVWKGINLVLAVDNLFNYVPSYYYLNSPPTTGTSFTAGVSIDVEKLFK